MAPQFGNIQPPSHATFFTMWMLIGFVFVLGITVMVDKLGTAMFHRGFAKPFYIKGRRIHHNVIYLVIPVAYGIFSTLFFLGVVKPVWNHIWIQLGLTGIIVASCIAVDLIGDKFWPEIRKNVILHHEWIYSIIPAYIFTYVIHVVI